MKKIFLLATIILNSTWITAQSYVQISNCVGTGNTYNFNVNGTSYKPLVCNYSIEFLQEPGGKWYISPTRQYTSNGHSVNGSWAWDYDPNNAANSVIIAKNKLVTDLNRMKNLGFTEIRLIGAGMVNTGTDASPIYNYPTGNQATYLKLMNQFLDQVNAANLRVILLMAGGPTYYNNSVFKSFINTVSNGLKNHTALMAYDLFNEPQNNLWPNPKEGDKYNSAKMINEWSECVRNNDPNHLVTIGLFGGDVFTFDPSLMNIDFVSYHNYSTTFTNISRANEEANVYLYWLGKTITMPYIIGENGFSGTDQIVANAVGNETDQETYLQNYLRKSVDCNCAGYSWWQYQEVGWGFNPPIENYWGLLYRYSGTTEGATKKIGNPVTSPFLNYSAMTQNSVNCPKPANYYSLFNGTSVKHTGRVKDENGNGIADAIVLGKDANWNTFYTYTDNNGYYSLATNGLNLNQILVSKISYSFTFIDYPSATTTTIDFTIKKISNNGWAKVYSNSDDPVNTLSGNWTFSAYDKFYKGDFNGDGQQDLLCAKYTNSSTNNDRMAMYTFVGNSVTQHPTGSSYTYTLTPSQQWKLIWDNQNNPSAGGGIYPYRHNLVVGNFDGDNDDDIISVGAWTTWFTFTPNANPNNATWNWMDSNYGTVNNPVHPMSSIAPYVNNVISGKFYNSGKDALIGVSASGWITSFQLGANGTWTWMQSNYGQTNNQAIGYEMSYFTPYKASLIAGDFDGDGIDEILGNALPSGALALFKPLWDNTRNSWRWVNSSAQPYWYDATNSSGLFQYRYNLNAGNFSSDKSDEILALNSSFAVVFRFGNFTSNSCSGSWDGGYYPTISDWNINPTAYKYLFINTDGNALNKRQDLLAIRNNSGVFTANLYSFRPNPEVSWPCTTLHKPELIEDQNIQETSLKFAEITIYPNPSVTGVFNLVVPNEEGHSFVYKVYNISGSLLYEKTANSNMIELIDISSASPGIYNVQIINNGKISNHKIVK